MSPDSTTNGSANSVTARQWIDQFAARLGVPPPDDQTMEQLLDLAGVAARSSERIAAPISCWLVGRAGLQAGEALSIARDL